MICPKCGTLIRITWTRNLREETGRMVPPVACPNDENRARISSSGTYRRECVSRCCLLVASQHLHNTSTTMPLSCDLPTGRITSKPTQLSNCSRDVWWWRGGGVCVHTQPLRPLQVPERDFLPYRSKTDVPAGQIRLPKQ